MDVHTKKQRSYNMSQVKSQNTKPEIIMFSLLETGGYKFEKHYSIIGKPDIAFPESKIAVFIDGEFWHGKKFNQLKESMTLFWVRKIGDNIRRDRRVRQRLRSMGWHVIRFWDKDIIKYRDRSFKRLINFLLKHRPNFSSE